MKFIGLLSGGKDSLFAVGKAMSMGHKLICTANLFSEEEADSFMFQTAATTMVPAISACLNVPYVVRELKGKSVCKTLAYSITEKDEVEDLYELILEAKYQFPEVEAVVSGSVLSDYQRIRVEHVCSRLGLTSISPLWRYNQKNLLVEMKEQGYKAVIVKISAMGLQEKHLGQEVTELIEYFEGLNKKFGFNVAGEGGEYETLILDSPIMQKRIVLDSIEKVVTGNSAYSPYGHLKINQYSLVDKAQGATEAYTTRTLKPIKAHKRHGELFTGEISASGLGLECPTFEHEAFCVLKALKVFMESQDMDLSHIYYVNAYIKSMKDFAVFNGVYSKFFNFPNPPSRVCCEVAQQECRVKISVKATSGKKKCIHVQSISSWAPASIGPYSQSVQLNYALHLAGSIPLKPLTMTLAENSLEQTLSNCASVAKISEFEITRPDVCFVYYTTEKIPVSEEYNPYYVQVSTLPRNSPIEIEMHLQQHLPPVESHKEKVQEDWVSYESDKRHCHELVHLNWFFTIERIDDYKRFVERIGEELEKWFEGVTHKSGVTKEQLLGKDEIVVRFQDYINEVRVFGPDPYQFNCAWVTEAPASFLHSESVGFYVQLQDFLQITTYQFINSGN